MRVGQAYIKVLSFILKLVNNKKQRGIYSLLINTLGCLTGYRNKNVFIAGFLFCRILSVYRCRSPPFQSI